MRQLAGIFISLEGGEGAGKSTLAAGLGRYFTEQGASVVLTREPGGTPLAEKVRDLALAPAEDGKRFSPLALALLMNAARADHLQNLIVPKLEAGSVVISDRFSDSTLAYQSARGGVSMALLEQLTEMVVGACMPQVTLLLDAPPETLLARRKGRAGPVDVFEAEDLEFHQAVREAFLHLARKNPSRIKVMDALLPAGQLLAAAQAAIESSLAAEVHG
ncbi:MAG: dTMP kinase [Pseudomonadota bacterium]